MCLSPLSMILSREIVTVTIRKIPFDVAKAMI